MVEQHVVLEVLAVRQVHLEGTQRSTVAAPDLHVQDPHAPRA